MEKHEKMEAFKRQAKQIAVDFVDEIIKSHIDGSTEQDECIKFWEEVKIEIKLL